MELRTDIGVAYARPSFWQRIYMLWTFRNFHRLPKEVLNKRQLNVLNKFCWSAMTRHELTIRNSVIGSVENVRLMRVPRLAVQSITTRVPEVSVANREVVLPRAAGSEQISVASSPAAHNQVSLGDAGRRNSNVWSISATRPVPMEETGTEVPFARAAELEEISIPSSPAVHNQISLGDVVRDGSNIWSESTPAPPEKTESAPEQEYESPAAELFQLEMYRESGRRLVQNRLAWMLAGAFGTLLLVGSFYYFRDSQQEDLGSQEDAVIYQKPASASTPPATDNQPEEVEQSAPANLKPPVTNPSLKSQPASSASTAAGPTPAAPTPIAANPALKPKSGSLRHKAPVINRVPKFQSATSESTPAISTPLPRSEFANSAPPASVSNPVLDPESTSSTVTPPSPAESRPPSEELSRTAVPRRRSVIIGPIPEGLPRIAETPEPGFRYPVVSNQALRGKVSLKAMVGIDGSVKQLSVLEGNPVLAAAAVRAVRHWRYRPYEIAGQAVDVQTNVTFNFLGHDVVTISFPAEP
jgi:TonB family protein